jgi:hypothetical protein
MTTVINNTCDVFISNAASDTKIASEIAAGLESAGLETFHAGMVKPGTNISEAIWEALAESRALIAIISPDALTHAMGMVEIGGAAAWNKPIFLLLNGPSSTKLPAALARYPVYPISRLEEVVRAIQSGFEPLTEDERVLLANIYRHLSVPADQLSQSPKALRDLTTQFNKTTHKQYSGERLLSEILRMRKRGQLPRLRTLQQPRVKPSPFLKRKKLQPPGLPTRKSSSD